MLLVYTVFIPYSVKGNSQVMINAELRAGKQTEITGF